MILSYRSLEKTVVALNDLIKINNDRIACYEQALNNSTNIDIDVRNLFKQIISEGNEYKAELINKVKQLDHNPKNKVTITGIIYRAWMDLKVNFIGNTRTSIINFCLYNEEIALHTYKAALTLSEKLEGDVRELIVRQQDALKNTYELIKSYKEARHYSDSRLVYFN